MKSLNITRRDFLKTVGLAAAAATFGCATTDVPRISQPLKAEPIVYPHLPGNKIQPPENGCLIGLQRMYVGTNNAAALTLGREFDNLADLAKDYDEMQKFQEPLLRKSEPLWVQNIKNLMKEYTSIFGKKPYSYVLSDTVRLYKPFPDTISTAVAEEGVVPYIHAHVDAPTNPKFNMRLEDVISGKHDKHIVGFARGAAEFGQKHGGFFLYTMPEPNGNWFYWNSSKFVPAWRYIWQIFEDQGANQYATWVWKPYCFEASGNAALDPEPFYPGDKYVDWIGLSAVSKIPFQAWNLPFDAMIPRTYERMRKDHLQKPLMQAEFGRTDNYDQPKWLRNAYKNIKNDFPALKAAIYWGFPGFGHDSTLNQKSLQTLGEIFKDPYWIMAK